MCNHIDEDKNIVVMNPLYNSGSIVVGEPSVVTTPVVTPAETTAPVVTPSAVTSAPAVTTPTPVTTSPVVTDVPPVQGAIEFTFDDVTVKKGDTSAELHLKVKNNTGFSAFQADLVIEGLDGFTVEDAFGDDAFPGKWSTATKSTAIQFVSDSGHNVDSKDGEFVEVDINIPANAAPGTYKVVLKNIIGSKLYGVDNQVKFKDGELYGGVSTLTIVGEETTLVETTPAPVVTTAAPVVTTAAPVVTTAAPVVTTTPIPTELVGDVNGDGTVNAKDLVALKKYLLLAATKDTVPNGDINKDGEINASDMIRLVRILLEKD